VPGLPCHLVWGMRVRGGRDAALGQLSRNDDVALKPLAMEAQDTETALHQSLRAKPHVVRAIGNPLLKYLRTGGVALPLPGAGMALFRALFSQTVHLGPWVCAQEV